MSTLKTTNLQSSDASSANIILGQGSGGGATISGVTTSSTLRATTGIVTTATITTADVTTSRTTTGITTTATIDTATVGGVTTLNSDGVSCTGISTAKVFVPTEGQLSHRNIVINGDMQVAQRGTSTTTINTYLIDRWRSYGGALGATWSQQTDATAYPRSRYALRQQRNSGTSQTNNTGVGQGIETKNSYQLAGQAVTLTFKARCGANFSSASNALVSRINAGEGTDDNPFSMTNTNGSAQTNTLTTSVQTFTHKWTIPSDKTQVTLLFDYNPVGTAGANEWFEITEVQLEVGSAATPFEYRSYSDELTRCQRYYWQITQTDSNAAFSGSTISYGSNYNIMMVSNPVEMRTTCAALTTSGTAADYQLWGGGTVVDLASVPTLRGSSSKTQTAIDVTYNVTAGEGRIFRIKGGSGAYLGFSAEL